MTTRPLCRVCAAKPALKYEPVCFDCFSLKETERQMVRMGRELADALRRIGTLEERFKWVASRLRIAETRQEEERRERQRTYARRYRERKADELRAYNREWMRAYRAREKVARMKKAA